MARRVVLKSTLVLLNMLVWISGAIFLSLGVLELSKQDYIDVANASDHAHFKFIKYNSYLLIAIALLLFISGFLGCCGSIREHRCMLGIYMVVLIGVVSTQLTLVIILFITKHEIILNASTIFKSRLQSFNYTAPSRFEFSFHQIQLAHSCCGVSSAFDFGNKRFPGSCCGLVEINAKCNQSRLINNENGCFKYISQSIFNQIYINSAFLIGFLSIEMVAFVIGVLFCRKLTDGRLRETYDNYAQGRRKGNFSPENC